MQAKRWATEIRSAKPNKSCKQWWTAPRSPRPLGHAAVGVCLVDIFNACALYMFEQFGVGGK